MTRRFDTCASFFILNNLFSKFRTLTLSYFRTYIYTYEIPKPLRLLYVYIRTRTLPSKYGALRYQHMGCSRAFGLQLAAILKQVHQRKTSCVYSELSTVFGEFWKITIVGPSSIHRLAWNTTANYMDFLP